MNDRHIVQIAASPAGNNAQGSGPAKLYALASDQTLWVCNVGYEKNGWTLVPNIPQRYVSMEERCTGKEKKE